MPVDRKDIFCQLEVAFPVGKQNRRGETASGIRKQLMYPRVRVKLDGEKAACKEDSTVLLLRRCHETKTFAKVPARVPTVLDQNKPHNPGTHKPRVRINKYEHTNLIKVPSLVKVSNDPGKSDDSSAEDNRNNIRASSVPRPRAVLSSPNNDGMIGNINRKIREIHTINNKTQTSSQNKIPERKPVTRSISTGRLACKTTKSSKEVCMNSSRNCKDKYPSDQNCQDKKSKET